MIVLTIRTDKPESEIGLYKDGQKLSYEIWEAHRHLAETLHLKIKQLLDSQGLGMGNLNGILVFEGPGSFTGLRIGISVANALAYGLAISCVGSKGDGWIMDGLESLAAGNSKTTVIPFYGREANITMPKK